VYTKKSGDPAVNQNTGIGRRSCCGDASRCSLDLVTISGGIEATHAA